MNNKNTMRWVFVCLLIILLLSSCRPGQMFGPTITPTPTRTPIPPTSTPTPIPPTSTPTPVPPTSTSTPTLQPTDTPIPLIDGMLTCTYRVSAYDHSTAKQYLDTGIVLKQGENLTIEATGTACFGGSNKDFCNDPNGHPDFSDTDLVGKIGNGKMFHIGMSFHNTISNETGKLYLGFNDTDYENNSGYFDVIITIENTLSRNCNP